ncbi:MAG: radical SAM protein [Spirochaetales bacterium]|nr:radical SAM protein [Spirochaetales bacterium]
MPDFNALYKNCKLCPRDCRIDRTQNQRGFCGEKDKLKIAIACLHLGEEPPLSGENGSGTIFFTGCTLKCEFCQNCQLSHESLGAEVTCQELADIMLRLQNAGAANINIVTGTHFAPGIKEALLLAKKQNLSLPILWNTSGFESLATLQFLEDVIDIYVPDLKSLDKEISRKFFHHSGYPEAATQGILYMLKAKPLIYQGDLLKQGVLVRHLALPGYIQASKDVLRWFADHLQGRGLFSLMFQYSALPQDNLIQPQGSISEAESQELLKTLDELGLEEGFVQELETDTQWLPDFNKQSPFPPGFSRTLWHFNDEDR